MAQGDYSLLISDTSKAISALDAEMEKLKKEQLRLAALQYEVWLRMEALTTAKDKLWSKAHDSKLSGHLYSASYG